MPGQDSILQLKVIVYEFRNGVPFALYNMHTLACMHKYTHHTHHLQPAHTHTCTHMHVHAHTHTHTHTHTPTNTHPNAHTHTHTHMHTHTHIHTHTPLPMQWIDKICTPTASNEAWQ